MSADDLEPRSFWVFHLRRSWLVGAILASVPIIHALVIDVHRGSLESVWLYILPLPLYVTAILLGRALSSIVRGEKLEPPLQLRLTTAIAMMVSAGVLMWLQL